jgi:ABC-type dipeptide/oligopeptide/nickel transport system ATPase component
MSDHDDKIVSLTGDPVYFNAPEGQLFSPSDVMEGTMASEPVELLTIARRHDGSMIVHGTHNIAAANGGYIVEEGAKDPRCYPDRRHAFTDATDLLEALPEILGLDGLAVQVRRLAYPAE